MYTDYCISVNQLICWWSFSMHSTYGPCRSNAQSNNPVLMVHLVLLAQQTAFVCIVGVFKWAIEEQQSSEHILHSLQISVSFWEVHSQRESSHYGTTCLPTCHIQSSVRTEGTAQNDSLWGLSSLLSGWGCYNVNWIYSYRARKQTVLKDRSCLDLSQNSHEKINKLAIMKSKNSYFI